jgi:DNA polymerase-3 subunit delta
MLRLKGATYLSVGYKEACLEIEKGRIKPVYLLYGEEPYLQEEWMLALKTAVLEESAREFNYQWMDGSKMTPAQVANQANILPAFAEKRMLVIKRPDFLATAKKETVKKGAGQKESAKKEKSAADPLLAYFDDPSASTCLVLWHPDAVDKRSRYYKALDKNGCLVEMPRLKGAELSRWIQQECRTLGFALTQEALGEISSRESAGLGDLRQELQKIALYYETETAAKPVTLSLSQTRYVTTPAPETNIFEMVDHIGRKEGEKAIEILRATFVTGEPPVRVLFMIARQFRLIFQACEYRRQGMTEKDFARDLSLHPFVAGKAFRQSANYSSEAPEAAVKLLRDCDLGLKSGAAPLPALENLILRLITLR